MSLPVRLIVVEGQLEIPAAKKLLAVAGVKNLAPDPKSANGCEAFWRLAPSYNQAAMNWQPPGLIFGLADLEKPSSAKANACAPELIAKHLPRGRNENFLLRVAVIELEAWLLADAEGLAAYLNVPVERVPGDPDTLGDPKQELVNLARKSRKKSPKDDIVPSKGKKGIVGAGYTDAMAIFIEDHWSPDRGAERSDSLRRAMKALRDSRTPR